MEYFGCCYPFPHKCQPRHRLPPRPLPPFTEMTNHRPQPPSHHRYRALFHTLKCFRYQLIHILGRFNFFLGGGNFCFCPFLFGRCSSPEPFRCINLVIRTSTLSLTSIGRRLFCSCCFSSDVNFLPFMALVEMVQDMLFEEALEKNVVTL